MNERNIYRQIFIAFVFGTGISISGSFALLSGAWNQTSAKLEAQIATNEQRIQSSVDIIEKVQAENNAIKEELRLTKENLSRAMARQAGLLNDIQELKRSLNLAEKQKEESNLPIEKRDFIESLENLIKDGAPFSTFLESSLIDIKNYVTASDLLKFKDQNVKSIEELKKDFASIAKSIFNQASDESFWKKQLRIFKEKLYGAIRVEHNDNTKTENENLDNKGQFEKAQRLINESKTDESLSILNKIKQPAPEIDTLKSNLNLRIQLNAAFDLFKNEFCNQE